MRLLAVPQPWRAVQAVADSQVESLRRTLRVLWGTPMPGLEAALAEGRVGPALQVMEAALFPAEITARNKVRDIDLRCINGAGEATWKTGMTPKTYTPKLRSAEAGSATVAGELNISFNRTSPDAVAWSLNHSGKLVTGAVNRDGVRRIIFAGFANQKPPRVIAKDIRQVIGMTERQTKKWETIKGAKAQAKYAEKAIRQRALLIARTETMRASNEGQFEAWRQGVKAGRLTGQENRVWITAIDDRTCPVCAPMDGAVIPMRGSFMLPGQGAELGGSTRMPPAHPACRCAMGLTDSPVTQPQLPGGQGEDWERIAPPPPPLPPKPVTPPSIPKAKVVRKPRTKKVTGPPSAVSDIDEALKDIKYRRHRYADWEAKDWLKRQQRSIKLKARTHENLLTADAKSTLAEWRKKERVEFLAKHAVPQAERAQIKVLFIDPGKYTAAERELMQGVIDDVAQLVHKNAVDASGKPITVKIKFNIRKDGRAYAINDTLFLPHVESPSVIAHELGHALEHLSKRNGGTLHSNIWGYLDERVRLQGKGIKKMTEWYPGSRYGPTEIADKDGFHDAYMGKIYRNPFTNETLAAEIGTMGLEDIINGMSWQSDNELLEVVLQSLRGQMPRVPPSYKNKFVQPTRKDYVSRQVTP